jgi:aminopeptidase N
MMKWLWMQANRSVIPVLGFAAALAIAAPRPPALRLGNTVQPEHMWLDLTLSPKKTDFAGKVEIDLRINSAVDHFWLNASELTVSDAKLVKNDVEGCDRFELPASCHT